jgi:hypothetical protein
MDPTVFAVVLKGKFFGERIFKPLPAFRYALFWPWMN